MWFVIMQTIYGFVFLCMFGTLVGFVVGCCDFHEEKARDSVGEPLTEEMRAKMYS